MTAKTATGIHRINAGNGHWYKIDGRKADGVTTLIKNGRPNPALIGWAAREVAEYVADNLDTVNNLAAAGREPLIAALRNIPTAVLTKAGNRGTAVHTYAEKLVKGEEVECPDDLIGHVEAYAQFLDEWQVEPVLVEAVVASRRCGYAGTTDLVADVTTPATIAAADYPWLAHDIAAGTKLRAIFDPKTSRSGVWPDHAYQLAAYRHADVYLDDNHTEQPMADLGIDFAAVVHVRADGYDVVPVNADDDTFTTFQYIATVARRIADDKQLIGTPVIPEEH